MGGDLALICCKTRFVPLPGLLCRFVVGAKLLKPGRVEGVAGVNLPMLIRALTYRDEPLEVALEKALSGATEGILRMEHPA